MAKWVVSSYQSSVFLNGLLSPKRQRTDRYGSASWYNYYAGFSCDFVEDILRRFAFRPGSTVLDPWNGVGTTTQSARSFGLRGIGFDLNPAVVLIAKARTLGSDVKSSVLPLAQEIVEWAWRHLASDTVPEAEPLNQWFSLGTARRVRAIETAIQHILIDGKEYKSIFLLESLDQVSGLAAFFYTALFRTVRTLIRSFRTSNPTWLLQKKENDAAAGFSRSRIATLFIQFVSEMGGELSAPEIPRQSESVLNIANSRRLPLRRASVSGVITSPPYCTRIDYAITMSPELAILGLSSEKFKAFRDQMMGTSTISSQIPTPKAAWGGESLRLIDQIACHDSYAASSYYLKTFLQYFQGLSDSLSEISRVLKPGGYAAIVVQDSYFKNLRVDLAAIVREMSGKQDLRFVGQEDFPQPRSMRSLNRGAKLYKPRIIPIESVVALRRA